MNCKFTNVLVFAAGALIGSAVTYVVAKNKYEKIIQEEVDEFKEQYAEHMKDVYGKDEETPQKINWDELEDLPKEELEGDDDEEDYENDMSEYTRIAREYSEEKGGADIMANKPYVISPYDFDSIDDYKTISLTYYEDGIVEDEHGDVLDDDDVEDLVGLESLTHFGEYEDDSVFVRNDFLQIDFEILRDPRTYAEANNSPDQVID